MCCMWPRFSVFQLSQSCCLRLARAMNVFHTCRRVIVSSQFSWCSSSDVWQFSDSVIATEFLPASCANLWSQMLSERCWRETSFISASRDRRQSFQSVLLATNTVAWLSDRHSEFVCRSLPGGRSNVTNWRTSLVVGQPSEVHFPYNDVRVFVSAGHRAVPDVGVVGTGQRRPRSRHLFTGKFQPSSTWPRRSTIVCGRDNGSPARSSRGRRCSDVLPSSSDVALVDTIADTISTSQCSGRRSPSPLLNVTCSSPSSRNVRISHADLRFTALHCSLLAAALPLSPFPFSPRISS